MVGLQTLDLAIGVRVPASQPIHFFNTSFPRFVPSRMGLRTSLFLMSPNPVTTEAVIDCSKKRKKPRGIHPAYDGG